MKTTNGWPRLPPTPQGTRYTICEVARGEISDRLIQLNHDHYAEEVKADLHGKGAYASKSNKNNTIARNKMVADVTEQGMLL